MAQKKAYSRYFIILQQDENGYSLASDKLPSGYTKLETKSDKCKVTYYVQNLKKELDPYYMVLICSKKDVKKLIKLGVMNIDEHGRAEVTYEYNTSNIAGSSLPIDLVTGAAVVKQGEKNLISVMSGFVAADVPSDWRSFELCDESRSEAANQENSIVEEKEEVKASASYNIVEDVETHNVAETVKTQGTIFDEYEEKIENIRQEKLQVEDITVEEKLNEDSIVEKEKDETQTTEVVKADTVKEEASKIEELETKNQTGSLYISSAARIEEEEQTKEVEYPIGTVGEFFRLIAEDFDEVKDACQEIKKCRWYKVEVKDLKDMCSASDYNKYTIVYYPMLSYYPYIKNHGHYLMGYKYDEAGKMKYIVYGIPGTRNIQDQPFGGKSGFVTWVSKDSLETRDDGFGYWLMFYDFRTSTIVVPVKKP